jgi:hypothetical protein
MDSHEKANRGVGKVLLIVFILVAVGMISVLAKNIIKRVDGDTITITPSSEDNGECGDAQAQQALEQAGIKVPVKCKNKK